MFLTCLQLVGTWVQHILGNLAPFLTYPSAKKGSIYNAGGGGFLLDGSSQEGGIIVESRVPV